MNYDLVILFIMFFSRSHSTSTDQSRSPSYTIGKQEEKFTPPSSEDSPDIHVNPCQVNNTPMNLTPLSALNLQTEHPIDTPKESVFRNICRLCCRYCVAPKRRPEERFKSNSEESNI